MKAKLRYVFSIAMFLTAFSAIAQNSQWRELKSVENSQKLSPLEIDTSKALFFELNTSSFSKNITSVTLRNSNKNSNTIISIPGFEGKLERFKLYEASVFAPELAAKYPEIKSYIGLSIDNPGVRLRMSKSPHGIQTMISYVGKPNVFMQPIEHNSNKYVLYSKNDHTGLSNKLECKTLDNIDKSFKSNQLTNKVNEGGANDQTLQKFRIAISTTGEYTDYHGGTVAGALAAINATLTRVNEIFETDMAVTFELIANNDNIIYIDASSDPYSAASTGVDGAWTNEIQSTLTSVIGENNYDIGHLFGATGGGGNAGCIGCVCNNNQKGSAFTSPANGVPEGDFFDVDFVAHEIGHQMGANHTWAFQSEGTGVNSEPGSGTTIMSYAGIADSNGGTSNDNVEPQVDPYFHYHSIKQILDNVDNKSCQTTESISNNPPSANAGSDFNIPKGTAYILRGSASDADGADNHTFCWEQIDSGITNNLNFGPTLATGPMNRSLPPTNSSDRYIPKFSSVLSGNTEQTNPSPGSDWETVATVSRTLNWALTVRDRSPSNATGGQSSYDTMQITVEDVTPFTVENPTSWAQGSTQDIQWVVGETTNGSINCQNVNILLSTDGGLTFATIIASNTPNDGSFSYTVPAIADTNQARILIEAADNIFYDVSDFNFSISVDPDFFMVNAILTPIECGATTAIYNFDYVVANGFSETTTFSAAGNPAGSTVTFSPSSTSTNTNVTMTISNLDSTPIGDYTITAIGTSTSITKNTPIDFPFYNTICTSVANTTYQTSTTLVQLNTINQASSKPSGYSDYTHLSADLNRNDSYNLTVNANTDGDWTTTTMVWIDWNQNCSFDDPGEIFNLGDVTNSANGVTSNSPFTILVPSNAVLGNTIMRVSTKFSGDGLPTSCESGFDGEVEDYTINVLEASSSFDSSINLVAFNTINQTSNKTSNYSDFTSVSTDVNRDSEYDLTVNVSTERNFTTATRAWIDWDQNGVFTDPGEIYDLGNVTNATNTPTSNSPLAIRVPIDAQIGSTTMRVATKFIGNSGNEEPSPTSNGSDGETEDYTINISPTVSIEEFGYENLIIYPNPTNIGEFFIQLNGSLSRPITIEIFDVSGQFIKTVDFNPTGDFSESVSIVSLHSGMYLVRVTDGVKTMTKKVVIY